MPQSQLALNIYDETGENAMLAYLAYAQRDPDHSFCEGSMRCLLPDRSSILIGYDDQPRPETTFRYTFQWTQDATVVQEHRPKFHAGPFPAPEPTESAISWPHTDSIQLALLAHASREAQQRMAKPASAQAHDPHADLPEADLLLSIMHRQVPAARAAVNQSINEDSQPDHLMAELEALQQDHVSRAIEIMPPDQYEQLVQLALRRLEE